mmetsp:Transcript_28219/g.53403  ORF Transcript_28219/g.53403 Transcript_28219/m.53403 type:complete len:220 (-) Transcript_28219:416-1075(-)
MAQTLPRHLARSSFCRGLRKSGSDSRKWCERVRRSRRGRRPRPPAGRQCDDRRCRSRPWQSRSREGGSWRGRSHSHPRRTDTLNQRDLHDSGSRPPSRSGRCSGRSRKKSQQADLCCCSSGTSERRRWPSRCTQPPAYRVRWEERRHRLRPWRSSQSGPREGRSESCKRSAAPRTFGPCSSCPLQEEGECLLGNPNPKGHSWVARSTKRRGTRQCSTRP